MRPLVFALLVAACTDSHNDRPPDAAPLGLCTTDSDCAYRANVCCSPCIAVHDPDPDIPLGACSCALQPPACLCQQGHCGGGSLTENAVCDPNRDECTVGSKCCATCCGVPPPDGGAYDPMYRCVITNTNQCPPVP